MPASRLAPGRYRLLSWGEASDAPRSSVLDVNRRCLFATSIVALALDPEKKGVVIELLSEDSIRVRWDDAETEILEPGQVVRLVALPGRTQS